MYKFLFFIITFICFLSLANNSKASINKPIGQVVTISLKEKVHSSSIYPQEELKPQAVQSMNKWLKIGLISLGSLVFCSLLFVLIPNGFVSLLLSLSFISTLIFGIGGLVKLASGDTGVNTTTRNEISSTDTVNLSNNTIALQTPIKEGDTIKISEPDFLGNIVYVNQPTGRGIALEKQKCYNNGKASAASYLVPGVMTVKTNSVVKGKASTVRVPSLQKLYFVVKVKDNQIDPSTQINIFPLDTSKKERKVQTGKSSSIGGVKTGDIAFQSFNATKYGTNSYLVELPNGLPKGEYAITIDGSRDVFNMFGVD